MLISWNTTNSCNLTCRHCYRDAGKKAEKELTTAEGFDLINQVSEAGFKIIIFSGGEPLMRQDIFKLVRYARTQGLKAVLGTNGTLLNKEIATRLKEARVNTVGISLDSVQPAKHDGFRGLPGAWQASVKGMQYCREAGLPFQIHTTVMDWNQEDIEKLTDFAVERGAIAHHIFFLVPVGRAADIEVQSLKAIEYERLLKAIMKKQKEVRIEIKPTCAPQFIRVAAQMGVQTRFKRGCLAGIAYCIIGPEGEVRPCAYLDITVGNVREMPFKVIWLENKVFQRLRTMDYNGNCGTCKYKHCCGGCRARAYFYHGDYMGEEPWCLLSKDPH